MFLSEYLDFLCGSDKRLITINAGAKGHGQIVFVTWRPPEPDFNPRLHDLLRSLAQEPHFAMALATQRPLLEVFPARAPGGVSPFHNIFTAKTLRPFTQAETQAFVTSRLAPTGVIFTEAELTELWLQSQGHPAMVQRRAKALFAEKTSL